VKIYLPWPWKNLTEKQKDVKHNDR